MADQFFASNIVRKEAVGGREVVIGDEVASLGHSEILKVVACPPQATIDKLSFSVCKVLDPVNLSRLAPEVFAAREFEPAKPELLRLWAILRIEFASIDKNRTLGIDELHDILRVVDQVVHDESFTDS